MKELKYIVYIRRSSEDKDKQLNSIETQTAIVEPLKVGRTVIDTYHESKSAMIANNRPNFRKMLDRIKQNEASGIICVHLDRLSRNPLESGELQWLLQEGILKSIVTPYKEHLPTDNAILFSLETSSANQFSRDLSVKVRNGLKTKVEAGQPPGSAPLGYLNTKSNIRGSNTIIKDPERWHIMRKSFEMMLTGAYTVAHIRKTLNEKYGLRTRPGKVRGGKPISESTLYRIFTDPHYYGHFIRKGILYKGKYDPMITVEEFDRIQLILGRKGKPRPKKHSFAFTGLIKCAECESAITACEITKRIKTTGEVKTYVLYHCTRRKIGAKNCTQRKYIPVEEFERQIIDEFSKYEIHPLFKDWAIQILRANHSYEIQQQNQLFDAQYQNEVKLKRELDNLVDLRLCEGITDEMYFQKKKEKENQILKAQAYKQSINESSKNWIFEIEDNLNFVSKITERFNYKDSHGKRDLNAQKEMCHRFGLNWTLKDKKLNIIKANWLLPIKNFKETIEAEFGRFEPEKTFNEKGENASFELLSPIVRTLIEEVRTATEP